MSDYQKILVCVDCEGASFDTFDQACTFAITQNAKLYIATVVDPKPYATIQRFDRKIVKRTEEEAHETLIKYQRRAIDKGLTNTETIFETGSPSIKITQHIVPNYSIDLVMIGANQGNKVERILVGSVSDAIIKSASCDVITVRSADIDHKAKNNLFIRSNKNTHEG